MSTTAIPGPLRLGDLLDRAFRLYRARLWSLLLTAAALLVPAGVLSGLLTGQTLTSIMDIAQATGARRSAPADQLAVQMLGLSGVVLLSSLLAGLAAAWATLALAHQSIAGLHGERPTPGESLRIGLGRLPGFIGLGLLQVLAIVVAMLIVLIPVILLVVLATMSLGGSSTPRGAAAVGMGLLMFGAFLLAFILLLIPVLYLSARWIAAMPVLVAERLGPIQALRRSWSLTRGQVWRCIGYLLLLGLLGIVLVSVPSALLQQSVAAILGPRALGLSTGLSTGIGQIVNVLWLPLHTAATILLYYDLRVRRESYDLALRIGQMEAQASPPEPDEDRGLARTDGLSLNG